MKISAKAAPTTIGLDIAKNFFQVHAVDDAGQVVDLPPEIWIAFGWSFLLNFPWLGGSRMR